MKELYETLKENFENVLNDGYDMDRFKSLPFSSKFFIQNDNEYVSEIESINTQIRSLSNAVINIKRNIDNEEYAHNANALKETYSSFRRNKKDHKYAEFFASNFSQFTLMADQVGISYDNHIEKLDKLCVHSKEKFSFMEDMAKLINEYVQLEPYLRISAYESDEFTMYKEEANDLLERYSEIIGSAPLYLELETKHIINALIKEYNHIKDDLLAEIHAVDSSVTLNISEQYYHDVKHHSGDLAGFMLDKKYEDMIESRITLTQSQKIQEFIVFDDSSVCYKQGGDYHLVKDQKEHKNVFSELESSIIFYQLRKKPKIAQYFNKLYTEYAEKMTVGEPSTVGELENILIVIDTYLDNEQILKNMKFDLSVFEDKSFEAADDYMHSLISKHKLHQYATSILSNKNKHLLNENCLGSFKVLMESGVSKSVIQSLVGKKLAAINSPEEFEAYLDKVIEHVSGFNEDILMDKLNNSNIKPVINENNVIVFEVDTFEQSQQLGSPSWCIARSNYYFNDYKTEDTHQYFLYDFNRDEKDNQSMIGFTVRKDGSLRTQHAKDDDYHEVDDFLQKIVNKILYTEKAHYELEPEKIEKLEQEFNPKMKKNIKKVNTP